MVDRGLGFALPPLSSHHLCGAPPKCIVSGGVRLNCWRKHWTPSCNARHGYTKRNRRVCFNGLTKNRSVYGVGPAFHQCTGWVLPFISVRSVLVGDRRAALTAAAISPYPTSFGWQPSMPPEPMIEHGTSTLLGGWPGVPGLRIVRCKDGWVGSRRRGREGMREGRREEGEGEGGEVSMWR